MQENPDNADLRTALEGAFEAAETPETPVEKPEQTRDESGKFAKAEQAEPVKTEAAEPAEVVEPEVPAEPVLKAPSSWKPDAQAAFNDLPPNVKQEVLRRESDYHKGIENYKTHAHAAQSYEKVVQPYMDTIKRMGVDAPTAIAGLLQADHTLRYSDPATKAQYFAQLAQQYGVDLQAVANPPQVDPQLSALQQQIAAQNREMQMWKAQQEQQQATVAQTEIQKFESDPANVHFESVKQDMAVLLRTGVATDLRDAYDKAVWQRGDIRQSLIEHQRAEAQKQALEQAQHAKAKAASVGVKGSSPVAGIQPVKGSLRDQLVAAMDGQ